MSGRAWIAWPVVMLLLLAVLAHFAIVDILEGIGT